MARQRVPVGVAVEAHVLLIPSERAATPRLQFGMSNLRQQAHISRMYP